MFDSENRINELNECILNHIEDASTWLNSCELRVQSNFGCGIFATRNIEPNELLFCDKPLILGPTGSQTDSIVCVMCYERIGEKDVTSFLCPNRCGLLLCGESDCVDRHKTECQLLQNWKPKKPDELSFTRLKAMLVIRSLLLNEKHKKFLSLMQKNYTSLKSDVYFDDEFENFPRDKEIFTSLRDASAAINANGYMVQYKSNDSSDVNVRSFYPTMSLLNHNCTPNARPDIDDSFANRIYATRSIKKDAQIFITYAQHFWGTMSRGMFTMASKQFHCNCKRCMDPTECSTFLSAIRCVDRGCNGIVLLIEPTNFKTDGRCNLCGKVCDNKRLLQTQDMLAIITKNFIEKDFSLTELKCFIEGRLYKLVPECNQFVVDSKLKSIWKCEVKNFEDLSTIKGFCEDILKIIDKLELGECSLKGQMAYKLYKIRKKLNDLPESSSTANGKHDDSTRSEASNIDTLLNDDELLWKTAKVILAHVSSAPADIRDH